MELCMFADPAVFINLIWIFLSVIAKIFNDINI